MNRDEIIEFGRLSIEVFEDYFSEFEVASYSFPSGAALIVRDSLQIITESMR